MGQGLLIELFEVKPGLGGDAEDFFKVLGKGGSDFLLAGKYPLDVFNGFAAAVGQLLGGDAAIFGFLLETFAGGMARSE